MSKDEEQKDELLRLVREGKNKGQEIVKKASDFTQFGQQVTDLAEASEEVFKHVPPENIEFPQILPVWQYVHLQEDAILGNMMNIATTSSSTVAYSMTDLAIIKNITRFVPADRQNEVNFAAQRLSHIINSQIEKGKVLSILREYGFTNAISGRKSPAEQFEIAWAAFEKPVTQNVPTSTSLIPMRECLNNIVAELLRRRSSQERVNSKRNKILSICHQFAVSGVTDWAVNSLADRWENLHDELSGSKDKNYSRPQWSDCLSRASLFLIEFLQSLDQSKMT